MPQTTLTIIGTLGGDPEIRDVGSTQVASFSVAVTERKKEGDQWVDAGTTWWRCSAWREVGQNVVASLHKGDRVILSGTIGDRTYTTRDGQEKTEKEVVVDAIGPELRFATASVQRAGGGGGGHPQQDRRQQQPQRQQGSQPRQDAWSNPGAYNDETPF